VFLSAVLNEQIVNVFRGIVSRLFECRPTKDVKTKGQESSEKLEHMLEEIFSMLVGNNFNSNPLNEIFQQYLVNLLDFYRL